MACQPILCLELGQRFAYEANSIPLIVVYHFKYSEEVKYLFGIIVTEKDKG